MAPDGFQRVVLASDGLWDTCSFDACAKMCRASETAEAAAQALLAHATAGKVDLGVPLEERAKENMHDDTSIVVVDLNPSQRPWVAPPPPPSAGCCAIL